MISCVNTRAGSRTVLPRGAVDLNHPPTVTPRTGDAITCTLSNTVPPAPVSAVRAPPTLNLTKTLGWRIRDRDQFTVQIRNSGGTVVNSTANSTTAGAGNGITPGTGTTGVTAVTAGGTYTLTEVAAGRWDDAAGFPLGAWFNELFYPLFEQACFADPAYGGNRHKVFWKMIGYPGLPAVNGLNMIRYRGKPFPGAGTPQSMEDFA